MVYRCVLIKILFSRAKFQLDRVSDPSTSWTLGILTKHYLEYNWNNTLR